MFSSIAPVCYGLLCLSVFLLWFPSKGKVTNWLIALSLAIILGLIGHQLEIIAIVPIILLATVTYYSQVKKKPILIRVIASVIVLVLSVGLATHQFPGFHNLNVLDHVYISRNAIPFTLYLNFDKAIVGIFIWVITNLLFVCVAEEALFRGFIQKNLSLMMKKIRHGDYLALLTAAILFGFAHYAGGAKYVILATVAGIGYGWVYLTTKRIEGSILTHFGLNLTHFLFFTYPALAIAT